MPCNSLLQTTNRQLAYILDYSGLYRYFVNIMYIVQCMACVYVCVFVLLFVTNPVVIQMQHVVKCTLNVLKTVAKLTNINDHLYKI